MTSGVQFPSNSVLDWYTEAEKMLADFLEYVPYCDAHKAVWSPKLVVVLQETCSQLDSLWRWEAINIHGKNDGVDIADYFEIYGTKMALRWVIFWADESEKIQPYSEWQGTQYCPLDWWKEGYNKVKHNRLENRTCATLKRTVESLAGLFLAIIRCESCWDVLWEKHWMSWDDSAGMPFEPLDCLREDFEKIEDKGRCNVSRMVIECRLFSYGVGIPTGLVRPRKDYLLSNSYCSNRFKAWYYNYCQSFPKEASSK